MKSTKVFTLLTLLGLLLVWSGNLAFAEGPLEVSQPLQVTSDGYYERGQSIVYGNGYYWLFYGRSSSVTGNYQNANPDVHDYRVYYKRATSVAGLASATPALVPGANNQDGYLGETGAAYLGGSVWAFATIDVGDTAELYGWSTTDGSSWTEVGPLATGLSDGSAHHDEIAFDGELFVVVRRGDDFYTLHTSTPASGGWTSEVAVGAGGGGLAHFFKEGSELYLAVLKSPSPRTNQIFRYDAGSDAWTLVDEAPSTGWDPTLFKVGDNYVFAQAPWVDEGGGRQYIVGWSGSSLSTLLSGGSPVSITEGKYGANTWVDMWPIGFTDENGDSYLFFTSERDPSDPTQEGTGNIWYLPFTWDPARDHYTYIQEAIDAATPGDTVVARSGVYQESLTIADPLTLACANAGEPVTSRSAGSTAETIIDVSGSFSGVLVQSSEVTIDGCEIMGDEETNHGIYVAAGGSDLSNVALLNNFIHGMAHENTGVSPRSYGILADAKAAGPTYGTIGGLHIEGNEIYEIGGTATAGGFGISLHEIVGAEAGLGALIRNNSFHDIHDDTGGLEAYGTAVSVFVNAGANSGDGGPSSGVSVTGNTYAHSSVGVSVFANDSLVSEVGSSFDHVPALVLNLSASSTSTVIDEAALGRFARSNRLAQLEPSFPGSEGYFAQIQPAVGASGAGAVVAVTEGVFYENVVIDKSLVLNPMPGATPVIDGGASDNVVTVVANEVVVEGFELRNGYNGIAGETSGSVFARNLIHDNLNIPGSAGVGILLWGDNDENAIQGNVIFNNDRQGILLGFSDDSKISNNNLISHNRIYDNGLYRYAKGPDESEHGVQLWHADASIVENNEIFGHDDWYFGHGIYLKASDGNGVFDNDLHDNMKGVSVHHGAVDNYLAGNVIHDNAYGLAIFDAGSHHTLVNFNQFCRNGSRGIYRGDFDAPKDVDATYNWWGSASGPGPVGPGTGDKVSEGINFWPWDDVPPTDGPCHINSIHIHKYKDLNVNGVKDEGEVGLNGWWLTLYNAQGKELMRRKTQTVGYQDGWALFEGVDPGEYKVCETLAGGWANSDPAGTPPCKWITVTDHGRAPSSGPLFAFFDHPGDDAYRLKYLGIDTWGLDPEQATEEEVLSRLSEPWLYVVSQLREPIDFADLLEDPPYALDPRNLIEWDVAEGFDTDLYYMTVDNEHFQHPIKLGVKSWRGKAGYSTATGFVEYGGVPTLLFGNYMPGSLEVVKHADQHQDHLFKFTFDGGDLFTLKHGQAKTFADLLPGSYTVAEKAAFVPDDHQGVHEVICQVEGGEGFFPSRDTYSAVVPVGFGEDVTCTFFNYPPPTVWVDDDWAGSDPGASVDGHTFGYDAFASVEVALDKVAPQGTVWVYDGTYEESVVVDKEGLSLQAASGLPMIKGSAGSEVVTVNAEDVTIDGFKIGGGSVGILGEMAGATITNNVIHDNEVGIHVVGYASDPAQILIADNELKMSSDAHVRFANLSADADIAALLTGNQTEDAGFAAIVINKAYLAAYDITIGGDPAHPNSFDGTGSHGQIYLSGAGWEDDDAPILATYNDFGVTLLEEIEEDIRHAVDDPALGMVDYFGIEVMADPSSVPAEGVSTATVTGSLTGLLSPAGNQIDFTTTLGELSASAGMTDADGEASVTLSSTDVGVATVTASAGASAGNPKAATTEVTLTEPVLTHFAFDPIDVQAFGASFEITIRAMSNAAPFDFDGSATLSDTTGTITPETVTFADGVWTGEVTIGLTAVDVVITAEADGITGSSDPFRVLGVPPEAEAFTFEPVTEQVAGAPFSITIYAIGNDSDGNGVGDVVDFNGYADLSDTTGTVTPTMIGPFDHGVWTGEVTIASAANEVVVTATDREDGTVVGSTDPFGVVAAEAGANEHFIYLPLVVK